MPSDVPDKIEGKIIIISAPSGSGKTTIVKHLVTEFDALEFSISVTTRPRREGEIDGVDYYFKTQEEFSKLRDSGAFVEWEEVYPGKFYGTLYSEMHRIWGLGKHVLFDIDVMGAINLKRLFPDNSLAVFLRVPSVDELRRRLMKRKTETPESLKERTAKYKRELPYERYFDISLLNGKLEDAKRDVVLVVQKYLERGGIMITETTRKIRVSVQPHYKGVRQMNGTIFHVFTIRCFYRKPR